MADKKFMYSIKKKYKDYLCLYSGVADLAEEYAEFKACLGYTWSFRQIRAIKDLVKHLQPSECREAELVPN